MLELAYALGRTLGEIGEMDLDELALWLAWLDGEGPRAQVRADVRHANTMAMLAQGFTHGKANVEPADFMPTREAQISEADAEKQLIAWCVSVGGKVGRRK